MRILVIDNDEIFLDKMKKLLTLDNHLVITALSGEEALLILDKNKFDLILSGLTKPSASFIDSINKIKEKNIKSTIILIADYTSIESVVEALRETIDDYIIKPFDISSLKKKITQFEM